LPRAFPDFVVRLVVQDSFALVDEILRGYVVQPDSIGIDMADKIGIGVQVSV
jgi:hypothetical protein